MGKVLELRPVLFSPGEVTITAEAYARIREAGLQPQSLLERHTRGDWSGGPVKWIEKNHLRFRGLKGYPVMSVYQLYPSENRVSVGTEADFSKTSITNWPDGTRNAELLPLSEAATKYDKERSPGTPGGFARNLLDGFGAASRQSGTHRAAETTRGRGVEKDR
jgi:hypothetical protein